MQNTVSEHEADLRSAGASDEENFASMFEESLKKDEVREGEIVKGRVIEITKDHVTIDIGYKSEGQIPLHEFLDHEGKPRVNVGDQIDVYLESRENDDG